MFESLPAKLCPFSLGLNVFDVDGHYEILSFSLNEGGTLKTLNSMAPASSRNPSDLSQHALLGSPDGTVYMTEDVFMRPPVGTQSNLLQRTKADVFKVTPAGGLFKSSLDANVTLYFPVQATEENITIIMQVNREINPLRAKFFRGNIKHIFTFYAIPPH